MAKIPKFGCLGRQCPNWGEYPEIEKYGSQKMCNPDLFSIFHPNLECLRQKCSDWDENAEIGVFRSKKPQVGQKSKNLVFKSKMRQLEAKIPKLGCLGRKIPI